MPFPLIKIPLKKCLSMDASWQNIGQETSRTHPAHTGEIRNEPSIVHRRTIWLDKAQCLYGDRPGYPHQADSNQPQAGDSRQQGGIPLHSQCYEFSEGSAMNAFTIPAQSCLLQAEKPRSPQLAYYYRAMAAGKHPRKLRSLGLPVVPRVATNADQAR